MRRLIAAMLMAGSLFLPFAGAAAPAHADPTIDVTSSRQGTVVAWSDWRQEREWRERQRERQRREWRERQRERERREWQRRERERRQREWERHHRSRRY